MNRVLYQLSYAAMYGHANFGSAEISFVIIPERFLFVKRKIRFFWEYFSGRDWVKIWKNAVLFYLGGTAYMTLEFAWRGRSYGSMFLLGGVCSLTLGKIGGFRLPAAAKAALGTGAITGLELLAGLAVNRDFAVWDYRAMPLNFRGQICLPYCLLWLPLSIVGMALYQKTAPKLER